MKLAVLGGGGFRTPTVYQALTGTGPGIPRVTEVALHDTDPQRLQVVAAILRQLAARSPDTAPAVTVTDDLDAALTGAGAVFIAIRVGGVTGRVHDERVALDLGLLGQETTGPGGIAFGLRTVPVVRAIARRITALAPDAFVIDFTNPAGMVTEALQAVLGDRVVGICDTPSELAARVARAAGVTRPPPGSTTSGSTISAGCEHCTRGDGTSCRSCSPTGSASPRWRRHGCSGPTSCRPRVRCRTSTSGTGTARGKHCTR